MKKNRRAKSRKIGQLKRKTKKKKKKLSLKGKATMKKITTQNVAKIIKKDNKEENKKINSQKSATI